MNAVIWDDGKTPLNRDDQLFGTGNPLDISNGGVIVGSALARLSPYSPVLSGKSQAIVWSSVTSPMISLDKFLSGKSPFTYLERAYAVNDSGEIVGCGWVSDTRLRRPFLAIPK